MTFLLKDEACTVNVRSTLNVTRQSGLLGISAVRKLSSYEDGGLHPGSSTLRPTPNSQRGQQRHSNASANCEAAWGGMGNGRRRKKGEEAKSLVRRRMFPAPAKHQSSLLSSNVPVACSL